MTSVFISYSHRDEDLKDRLLVHLIALERQGLVSVWHDRKLKLGEHLDQNVEAELAASDVVMLLISPDFLASNYCFEKEMQRAFARAKKGATKVAAVILQPCQWMDIPIETGGKLGDFLAAPSDGKPVAMWSNENAALNDAVVKIKDLLSGSTGDHAIRPAVSTSVDAFKAREPLDRGKFRAIGVPVGTTNVSFGSNARDIFLGEGPAQWLRVFPAKALDRRWSLSDLNKAATRSFFIHPIGMTAGGGLSNFRAEDGVGTFCVPYDDGDSADWIVMLFDNGEIWTVDFYIMSATKIDAEEKHGRFNRSSIYLNEQDLIDRVDEYVTCLGRLGIDGPFKWIIGCEETKHRGIHLSKANMPGVYGSCVSDNIVLSGDLLDGRSTAENLEPYFSRVYDLCGLERPALQ